MHHGPRPRLGLAALLGALLVAVPGPAAGQEAGGPSIAGWARLAADGRGLTIRASAVAPPGWQAIHLIEASVGQEQLRFDVEDQVLTVDGASLVVGTGAAAVGRALRVDAGDVVVTTGGARLELTIRASVVGELPAGTPLRLAVTDDHGRRAELSRRVSAGVPPGSPWTAVTVLGTAAAALLAGILVGGVLGARRHPRRVSIYAAVQRRLEQERAPGRGGAR